ncbi:hypothetical protein [Chitinophaga sancti]|uniref:Uncharacterized protein n=1 Tax=Chitinophaga sancti TaxID=1004 RepID=A0A1K1SYA5_9BACT|nr:hypothetical protein [Chitinophaga sancti]WQD63944.1 hypothetical protein U0033_06010 [Chitinophaga sancti]WQG90431.1 hypothetical protein SR876_02910 [Chitinophaga sancti]SFW89361.1 hypothetical protein SAMN05661012_06415 [Chitinophaga sancti]
MYDVRSNLVIGFHGCDKATRDELINNPQHIKISEKPYDWLGHGFYLWENNCERALQWSTNKASRGEIKEPAVVGAIIHLGYCCDFLDSKYIGLLKPYYLAMYESYTQLGQKIPVNKDLPKDPHKDRLLRELDCAVIEYMHAEITNSYKNDLDSRGITDIKLFDTVRGVFTEGGPAFDGAGILEKNHIQICIRNFDSIKGFFIPRQEADFLSWSFDKYLSPASEASEVVA